MPQASTAIVQPPRGERAAVGGRVDAVRAAGHDGPAALGQAEGELGRRRGRRTACWPGRRRRPPTARTPRPAAGRRAATGTAAGRCRAAIRSGPSRLMPDQVVELARPLVVLGRDDAGAEPVGAGQRPARPAGPGRPRPAGVRRGPQLVADLARAQPREASTGPTRATSWPSSRLPGSTRWASAIAGQAHRSSALTAASPVRSSSASLDVVPGRRRRGRPGPQWTTRAAAPGRSRGRTAIPGPAGVGQLGGDRGRQPERRAAQHPARARRR